MKEYQPEELHMIQQVELSILKDIIALCEEHNLTYFGLGGTCIGVLRHQGFIPWDDDIDIGLMRGDYEELLKLVEEKYPEKYTVMNFEHDHNYPLMTTRIMLKGTKFREETLKNIKCELGIFLDVYAYDSIPDDEKLYKKQAGKAFFWSKLLILRSIPFPVLVGISGFMKVIIHAACGLIYLLLNLFRVSREKIYNKCYEASTRYDYLKDTERINYICDTNSYVSIYKRKDVFPVVKLPFEDIEMTFPNNMHDNLTGMFGDYMKLPPVEKRKNHYPYELDFGPFGRE